MPITATRIEFRAKDANATKPHRCATFAASLPPMTRRGLPMPDTNAQVMTPSRPLIEGPSAWLAADMRKRESEWTYHLSPSEIAEIETALKSVQSRGLDIAEIRRDDFPLPTLGHVLDRLRAEVLNGRGFVLLRGVPVEARPIAESAAAYWGIGSYFGS